MKFAALALALLLAVGSQAASLQADAPSQLEHARAAMDVLITSLKESIKNVVRNLDDNEYGELKTNVDSRLDGMHNQLKEWQQSVSPMTDNLVNTIAEATAELRQSVQTDIANLKAELQPLREELTTVVKKNTDYYHTEIQKILDEYRPKHEASMAELRTRLEPVLANIEAHAEETKAALIPIVSKIRNKVVEHLEQLKEMAKPYIEEYKEQLKQAYNQAQSIKEEDLTALKAKIEPLVTDIGSKFQQIFEIISTATQATSD